MATVACKYFVMRFLLALSSDLPSTAGWEDTVAGTSAVAPFFTENNVPGV